MLKINANRAKLNLKDWTQFGQVDREDVILLDEGEPEKPEDSSPEPKISN